VVAGVTGADPATAAQPVGRWLLLAVGCWAVYRIATRSQLAVFTLLDFAITIAVCVALPAIVSDPQFFASISAPQAVAGAAVASFAVQVAPLLSLPMTLIIAGSFASGATALIGWRHVAQGDDIYFFFVQWATATLVRSMIWRIVAALDRARADRQAVEIAKLVAEARRNYDREQLAVLHDTAAATMLLVGQGAALPPGRLSAQARRDLEILQRPPWKPSSTEADLVGELRQSVAYLGIPVHFSGEENVSVGGELAAAVVNAVREATNNVDRHAHATMIHIDVGPQRVTVSDDGVGFTPGTRRGGHGMSESIVGRMRRVGGTGAIRSCPDEGTIVELSWVDTRESPPPVEFVTDTDRFINRVRVAYGLAITGCAVANLAATVPWGLGYTHSAKVQAALAGLTAVCALAVIPATLHRARWLARAAAVMLGVIALLQPALLSTDQLSVEGDWSQGVVGFCVLPLLLGWPAIRAGTVLSAYWLVPAAVNLLRDPSAHMMAFIGLGVASSLIPQLFTLAFGAFARNAAHRARAENEAHLQVLTAESVAEALQDAYVGCYAEVINRVVPLLTALSRFEEITPDLRRRARIESRRLRMLLDRTKTGEHPLAGEIRSLAESAEERGIDVSIHLDDELPEFSADDIREFATPIALLLSAAQRSARIVLTASGPEVIGSVVCDMRPGAATEELRSGHNVSDFVSSDGNAWMTVRQTARDAFPQDDFAVQIS
jgi:hypothetical protein